MEITALLKIKTFYKSTVMRKGWYLYKDRRTRKRLETDINMDTSVVIHVALKGTGKDAHEPFQ